MQIVWIRELDSTVTAKRSRIFAEKKEGMRACRNLSDFRPILDKAFEIFGETSENVVAAPQHRAAANTAMGWKNANLRSESNSSVSSHCTCFALGLATHHGSPSKVTCWSPRMILQERQV